jgi:antitoxin component YwqK of YwqJK toxin-antitoxin module
MTKNLILITTNTNIMLPSQNTWINLFAVAIPSFMVIGAVAQQRDTTLKFLDARFEATSQKNMVYKAQVYPNQEHYTMEVALPSGQPVYSAQYKDADTKVLHGQYVRYYTNGNKQSMATFINGKTEGVWMWWHDNGQLMDSGMARNGIKDGTWYHWYPGGQLKMKATYAPGKQLDSVGKGAVASSAAIYHGPFKAWYENGMPESEGGYVDNVRVGTWRWYHENGKPAIIEEYNTNGKVTAMECFDTTGAKQGDFCSLNKPAFLKDLGPFPTFFQNNFTWPKAVYNQKKKGSVWVSFIVTKEGRLSNVEIKGTTKLLEEAVKEFLYTLPPWEPAISHNRVVSFEEKIEVIYEGRPKFTKERQEFPEMWRPDYIKEAMWE